MKVLLGIDGDLGHFLAACAAVEQLKKSNPALKITINTPDEEQAKLLKSAWFVNSTIVSGYGDLDISKDEYDFVHLMRADIEESKKEELRRRVMLREAIDGYIGKMAEANNISVDSVAKPDGYEKLDPTLPPVWNLVNGYCFDLQDSSGWDCFIPGDDVKPWAPSWASVKELANKYLHANRRTIKAGTPYVIVDNLEYFENKNATVEYPESWEFIEVNEQDTPAELLVGLIRSPRCKMVIGPTGGAIYAAWAADVPVVEAAAAVSTAYWSSCRSAKAILLAAEKEEFSDVFTQTVRHAITKRYGIEWQN